MRTGAITCPKPSTKKRADLTPIQRASVVVDDAARAVAYIG